MIGIAKTIGRLIAVLVDAGIVDREKAVWILEPLKDKAESEELQSYVICRTEIEERYNKEDKEAEPCETNLQALQKMDAEELARFITDLTHYDDTDYEWKSNLMTLLPFEDWEDWLNRRAIYGKG